MNTMKGIFAKKKAYIAYLTAGQRDCAHTVEAAVSLVEAGVDILEIGVPFSDPIADGPVIQQAMNNALLKKCTLDEVLMVIKQIKQRVNVPIVLFSYYNPILKAGLASALQSASRAGVDGILVVDLPLEEADTLHQQCLKNLIEPVSLLSPSTNYERIKKISQHGGAFLYYVCRNGTSGVKSDMPEDYANKMKQIKSQANQPIVSGFGIGSRALAEQALKHADGFVVGSAFVNAIASGASLAKLKQLAIDIDPR